MRAAVGRGASDAVHEQYTKGISVHQCSLGTVGEMSIWEFSGNSNYYVLYDHFIGNVNCEHVVLFNLADGRVEQERQLDSWLTFLRSKIPPVEPLRKLVRLVYRVTQPDSPWSELLQHLPSGK